MNGRFVVRRGDEAEYTAPGALAPGSEGLTRWAAVTEDDGSVHTGFGISRLSPTGSVPTHVHSFEESFHILEGTVILVTPEATVELVAGDYGVIPIGVPHSWHGAGSVDAVWSDVFSPVPRAAHGHDTYRVPEIPAGDPVRVDARDPRTRSFGAITAEQMDPSRQSQENPRPVGEHAHCAAGLQRHLTQDDGRLRPRIGARARCSWCSTSPTEKPGFTIIHSKRRT